MDSPDSQNTRRMVTIPVLIHSLSGSEAHWPALRALRRSGHHSHRHHSHYHLPTLTPPLTVDLHCTITSLLLLLLLSIYCTTINLMAHNLSQATNRKQHFIN